MHTDMSSSYRWTVLGLVFVFLLGTVYLSQGWYFYVKWISSLLLFDCHCQCNQLPGKTRPWNELLCVEWDVKTYTLTRVLIHKVAISEALMGVVPVVFKCLLTSWSKMWRFSMKHSENWFRNDRIKSSFVLRLLHCLLVVLNGMIFEMGEKLKEVRVTSEYSHVGFPNEVIAV